MRPFSGPEPQGTPVASQQQEQQHQSATGEPAAHYTVIEGFNAMEVSAMCPAHGQMGGWQLPVPTVADAGKCLELGS